MMTDEIKRLTDLICRPLHLKITEITSDPECEAYSGFNFKIDETPIKFRKSKLTPKKVGQFVTFWKRDPDGQTVPFDIDDNFNFYIIAIKENNNSGFFIFPKTILVKENMISEKAKSGKRGFRVYADWHFPDNKQAEKTKLWQTQFFINLDAQENIILEKFEKIFQPKSQ